MTLFYLTVVNEAFLFRITFDLYHLTFECKLRGVEKLMSFIIFLFANYMIHLCHLNHRVMVCVFSMYVLH